MTIRTRNDFFTIVSAWLINCLREAINQGPVGNSKKHVGIVDTIDNKVVAYDYSAST